MYDQSPVNISTTVAAAPTDSDKFFFAYPTYEAPVKMVNDGRFLYTHLKNDDGSVGGFALGQSYPDHLTSTYYIYKMVMHTPSEHTYNGVRVPLELQLYHRKAGATLTNGEPAAADTAVVSVGYAESRDEASPFLRSLIDGGLPDQRGGTTMDNRAHPSALRFSELFAPVFGADGEEAGFWDYTGSLTQPPCTAGVRWFVRQQTLNAKPKTLKYFTDVVKKASGGVAGNARQLQDVGNDRPVFPRYAENAVHMKVYDPEEPDAFKTAMSDVGANQDAFKKGLEGDTSADAALTGGVMASSDYQECLNNLGTINAELEAAKAKATSACNEAEGYHQTMESVAGGPAQIEAAQKGASAQKSCDDETKVVSAKEGQSSELQTQCDEIKAQTQKDIDAAAADTPAFF
jgi:carbonic anhydrase